MPLPSTTAAATSDAPIAPPPDATPTSAAIWRAAWRQHRQWAWGLMAVAVVSGLALPGTLWLQPDCPPEATTPMGVCFVYSPASTTLWQLVQIGLSYLPFVVGAIVGAVTFGPDAEHRTAQFALTQGVSRVRWWTPKVIVMGGPPFIAMAVLGLGAQWVSNAVTTSSGLRMNRLDGGFFMLNLMPAVFFAVGFAAAASIAALRRTVAGLVVGFVVGVLMMITTAKLEPVVAPQQRIVTPIAQYATNGSPFGLQWDQVAFMQEVFHTTDGRTLDANAVENNRSMETNSLEYFQSLGIDSYVRTYVDDSAYWPLMWTFAIGNLLVAAGFLALGVRAFRRADL